MAKVNTSDNRNWCRRAGFEAHQAGSPFGTNHHFAGQHPELDAAYQEGWDNYQRTKRIKKEARCG